ncbi:MAG: phosphatidylglycerophosphatase A [bacterium]
MDRIILFFASGFFSGYAPLASGTVGTLVGIAIYILLNQLPLKLYGILTLVIVIFGIWLSYRAEAILGEKDSGVIVIDEIAGFLVTMFALPMTWQTMAIGFFMFRAFDIFKPFPIRRIDQRLPGGWGVMLDDVLAGVYANLTIQLLRRVMLS